MKTKEMKGITLVALVVTIVVLLILAGVSINLVLGNNGIIAKAKDAETKSAEASENDLKGMNSLIEQMESTLNGSGNGGKTEPETVPYLPSDDFHYDTSTSIDTGLVIKDGKGNEYVWVVVPRTTAVYKKTGLGKTTFTDADYTSIEKDLKEYTKTYRGSTSYSDTYTADDKNVGWFADATAYNNLKNSMLKSVYENGGFYVGRYEAGIDTTTGTKRTSNTDKNSDGKYTMPSTAPVTKADAYPYTYVTRTQAQNLASKVNSGTKKSSLMFGVQWDLVLAFMSKDTAKITSTDVLTKNSVTIGNYKDNLWTIKNAKAQYSSDYGYTFTACPNPFKKESNSDILLTTGADSRFSVQNIYDIAGNVAEWTLESPSGASNSCAVRGGRYCYTGSYIPAALRSGSDSALSVLDFGFRVSLF
jgi:hypothetical protein